MRFIPAGAGNTGVGLRHVYFKTVYPRWRGEHQSVNLMMLNNRGLSPLARGTLVSQGGLERTSRFIPAGAGNTIAYVSLAPCAPVYPRWRGEHTPSVTPSFTSCGLSPLARGTLLSRRRNPAPARFIPAGAGNTSQHTRTEYPVAVYPRWRGEHCSGAGVSVSRHGLSPLARGTRGFCRCASPLHRFIPAGAGNTCFAAVSWITPPVYPRWRGEHRNHI